MFFWNDPSLKPLFWPERVPFENIKSATKSNLRKIIESYKEYTMKERVSISHRSRSPKSLSSSQASRQDNYRDRSRSPLDLSDVDTSNGSFDELFQQPEIASNNPIPDLQSPIPDPQLPTPTFSLVTLLGVKPLDPI